MQVRQACQFMDAAAMKPAGFFLGAGLAIGPEYGLAGVAASTIPAGLAEVGVAGGVTLWGVTSAGFCQRAFGFIGVPGWTSSPPAVRVTGGRRPGEGDGEAGRLGGWDFMPSSTREAGRPSILPTGFMRGGEPPAGIFGLAGATGAGAGADDGAAGALVGAGVVDPGSGGAFGPMLPAASMNEPWLAALKALRLASNVPSARAWVMLAARGDIAGASMPALLAYPASMRLRNWSGDSFCRRTPPTRRVEREAMEPGA